MAFTLEQRAKIKQYMGYGSGGGSIFLDPVLDDLGSNPIDEANILESLDAIGKVDEIIKNPPTAMQIKKSGNVEFNNSYYEDLRHHGAKHIGQLALQLGYNPINDYFQQSRSVITRGGL